MEKAVLILYSENEKEKKLPVLFNPSEYNISRSVNYAKLDIPGLDNPIMQFISGGQTSLKLTLHFDTQNTYISPTASTDVREYTSPIMDALWIDGKVHAPPMAAFSWGGFFFKGVITEVQQSFTMFLPNGLPIRAKVDLTFINNQNALAAKRKSPFESPDRTKTRYAQQSVQLWRMANAEYGDPKYWRVIADYNGIYNPRKFPSGKLLHLPPLKEL